MINSISTHAPKADEIRVLLARWGLKQYEIAKKVGQSAQNISVYCSGKRQMSPAMWVYFQVLYLQDQLKNKNI